MLAMMPSRSALVRSFGFLSVGSLVRVIARATPPFTNRTSRVSHSWFVFPRRTVTSTPVAVGRIVDVGPAEGAHLAPPHPPMKRSPGVEAAALEGDLLGRASPGRGAAGWWQVARTVAKSAAPNGRASPGRARRRSAG